MAKIENKKARTIAGQATARAGQAAIELAVFGAILIFILGTIVRTAVGNGYTQNENFKAMRMAMLNSWRGSEAHQGKGALADLSRNNASVIFVEDRLSPDFNKYGDIDRTPFIAQGAGTFTFNLFYPWQPGQDPIDHLIPIMDVYINGQHFPFTTANYVINRTIQPLTCGAGGPYPPAALGGTLTPGQCLQNQCLRSAREWAGGNIYESQLEAIVPSATLDGSTVATMECNASKILAELIKEGILMSGTGADLCAGGGANAAVRVTPVAQSPLSSRFVTWLEGQFPGTGQAQVNQIQNILQSTKPQYKLFYTREVNGTPQFSVDPPGCSDPPGTGNALCSSLTVTDASGHPFTNANGDMQYDLLRNGDYNSGSPTAVETQLPPGGELRYDLSWQWGASAATSPDAIGLNTSSNEYPTYDIDGRLKEVTIYGINQNTDGTPTVSYEDFQGGDIDPGWDSTSCGPKPGLQSASEIYTFTKQGTYLQIKEGKLYNPETDAFVRSANQRDTIDLIQRTIQLSNNTGDFCKGTTVQPFVMSCQQTNPCTPSQMSSTGVPNPVEICVDGVSTNCFTQATIAQTCFDTSDNMIYVRSRLEDRRGRFWFTDTTGDLKVH